MRKHLGATDMLVFARFAAIVFMLAMLFAGVATTLARAEKRVALVVGNSAYVNVPRLDNPKNDARLMADTLRVLGFTLIGNGPRLDLDKSSFDAAVQEFGNQAQGADVALFFYAGPRCPGARRQLSRASRGKSDPRV